MKSTAAIGIVGSLALGVAALGCAAGSEDLDPADLEDGDTAEVEGGDTADVRDLDTREAREDVAAEEAPACTSDCGEEGAAECSDTGDSVLSCTNVGTVDVPCLRFAVLEGCDEGETCTGAACTPVLTGCCTIEGTGCCAGTDNCYEDDAATEACRLREHLKNGSEVCDDVPPTRLDPAANRYFLVCLNDHGGTAYLSTNSGGPCSDSTPRCQCWEEAGIAPWDMLDYLARLVCDEVGKRMEVVLPGEGLYHWGVHSLPGIYELTDYCPRGEGCQTGAVLLELAR